MKLTYKLENVFSLGVVLCVSVSVGMCMYKHVCAGACMPWCTRGRQKTTSSVCPYTSIRLKQGLLLTIVHARLADP